MSNFLKSSALIVVSIALSFLTLELYVRAFVDDGLNYELEMWKYAKLLKQVSDDPNIGHEHRPNTSARLMGVDVATNSAKLRDREFPLEKPIGSIRILMLGDSITFGWGVEATDSVTQQLESEFSNRFPKREIDVINAGVGNYNTVMEVSWFLSKGITYEPDIVVLNYFVNDAELTPARRGGVLRESSAAYVFLASRFDTVRRRYIGGDWLNYYRALYASDAPGWALTQESIRALAKVCQERNIKLVIASYPELHELTPYPLSIVTRALAALAKDLGVLFVDLLPSVADEIPQTLWVTPDDAHPNAVANQKYTRLLSDKLAGLVSP
jgi:lysophospholipase L1-like esterase